MIPETSHPLNVWGQGAGHPAGQPGGAPLLHRQVQRTLADPGGPLLLHLDSSHIVAGVARVNRELDTLLDTLAVPPFSTVRFSGPPGSAGVR